MMKKLVTATIIGLAICMGPGQASALSPETEMLLELLQAKGVISQTDADSFKQTIARRLAADADQDDGHYHSVQSLATRLEKLEKQPDPYASGLLNHIELSGLIEVEAASSRDNDGAGTTSNSSDISLATAELDLDVTINDYMSGHLAFLYEEDSGDPIILDVGIISLTGGEQLPLALNAGRMYLPFGQFESHFITDPLTLTLGETNDAAVVIGYENPLLTANIGAFNGAVHEDGKDDTINSFVGSLGLTLPEGTVPGLAANIGISYLSNMATSDELQGTVSTVSGNLTDMVASYSAFGHFEFHETFFLELEYLSAVDDFTIGDLTFIDADNRNPSALNIELAAAVLPQLEVGLRYGSTSDVGNAYPDNMYGAVLLYGFLDNAAFILEYMDQEFSDNSDSKSATAQIAVEF